ncbi:ankyrin repeat-containing domain protein, partial [Plectosphaerella plurivora]
LGLEVVYPQPGDPVPAKYLRNIICVHGLGRDSIRTWHHETAGKTWISDPEFLGSLSLSARVLTYTYNSDLSANMSSASIGLHASELLELITICFNQTGGGPTIFVAHGFGGIIVKKVKTREPMTALTPLLEIANVVEKLPTLFGPEGADTSHHGHVVPSSCARFRAGAHQAVQLDRDHLGLAIQARTEFQASLSGWSQTSTGSHILPIPGSCSWLRNHDSFKLWLDAPVSTAVLCHGPPGSGKTHWAKSIINHLGAARPTDIVISFFCDGAETGDTEPAILESLIYQIVCRRPEWFRELPNHYTERRFNTPRRTMESLSDMLLHLKRTRTPNTVFFVIDGIDECTTDFTRKFLRHVSAFVDRFGPEKSPSGTNPQQDEPGRAKFKFLFTSKQIEVVRQAPCWTTRGPGSLAATETNIREDISIYVNTHVDRLGMSPNETAEHKIRIKRQADTFFPFAAFACAEVSTGAGVPLTALAELNAELNAGVTHSVCPDGLARYYDRQILPLLQSIGNDQFSLDTLFIMCVHYPCRVDRSHILDFFRRSRGYNEQDNPMPDILSIISQQCSRLIDMTNPVLALTHEDSLYPHLLRLVPDGALYAHMVKLCLRYLSAPCFTPAAFLPLTNTTGREQARFLPREYPFYLEAMHYWPKYLQKSEGHTDKVMSAVRCFLSEDSPQYQAWCIGMTTHDVYNIGKLHPCTAIALSDRPELVRPFLPTAWNLSGPVSSWEKGQVQRGDKRRLSWKSMLPAWPPKSRPFFSEDVTDELGRGPLHFCCDEGLPSALALFLTCPLLVDQRSFPPGRPGPQGDLSGETPLFNACRRYVHGGIYACRFDEREPRQSAPYLEAAKLLLEAGANPNLSSYYGTRCLHVAVMAESPEFVDLLLKFGAEVNVSDVAGKTILQAATSSKSEDSETFLENIPMLERLIEAGIDLDARYSDNNPPISVALERDQLEVFRLLAQHVSDINQRDVKGLAPIQIVIATGRSELLPCLLERPDVELDLLTRGSDSTGITALGLALKKNDLRAVQLLLAAGASPGYVPGMEQMLPLAEAVCSCELPILRLLLEYGAPVNALNDKDYCKGETALTTAIRLCNEDHVRVLLENGADPTIEEAYGLGSALSWAVPRRIISVVRMLLEHVIPPDVNYRTKDSPHVLFDIFETDSDDAENIVKLLLEHGMHPKASFDVTDERNPVHALAEEGLVNLVKILVEHDRSLLDMHHKSGMMYETPLHVAAVYGRVKTIAYMLAEGAVADTKSFWYEETPFAKACVGGELEAAKLLFDAAPHVLEEKTYCGETPLMQVCDEVNIKIIRFLLEKGANFRVTDCKGVSIVRRALEQHEEDAVQLIRLFVGKGLGPNEIVGSHGLTVLGEAIRISSLPAVRYLLSKGGDPIRCQLCLDGTTYRTGLHVAANYREPEVAKLLLEMPEVREHLADVDDSGENALFVNPRRNGASAMASTIFWTAEEVRRDTGRDVFAEMATASNEIGRTAVDVALHGTHVFAPPEAIPSLRAHVREQLAILVTAKRTFEEHLAVIERLSGCLADLGGHDAQEITLMQMILTVPEVIKGEEGYSSVTRHRWSCDGCEEKFELMHVCRFCSEAVCSECVSTHEPGVHSYLAVPPPETIDLNSIEMQTALDTLRVEFDADRNVEPVPVEVFRDEPGSAATTLSLATMHAFGYLEFRRRAWSPYIGLARAVHERIEPWAGLISEQRTIIRDRVLDGENAPERLREELGYFLSSGRRTAYQDEAAIRYGWVLEALGICFQEPAGWVEDDDDDDSDDGNDSDDSVTIV